MCAVDPRIRIVGRERLSHDAAEPGARSNGGQRLARRSSHAVLRQRSSGELPALEARPSWRRSSPLVLVLAALLAPLIAPHRPLRSAHHQPASTPTCRRPGSGGDAEFPLGTDDQGRDILSTILYGTRSSRSASAVLSVVVALTIGLTLGLVAGYVGGRLDSVIMRIADVQLTFPAILTALLIDGVALAVFGQPPLRGRRVLGPGASRSGCPSGCSTPAPCAARRWSSATRNTSQAARLIGIDAARHHVPARAAERRRAGAGDRHHQPRARDHHRGDAVVPRASACRRPQPSLGTMIQDRQQVPVLGRVVDRRLPGPDARRAGAGGQSARRLAARCAQSQAALNCAAR